MEKSNMDEYMDSLESFLEESEKSLERSKKFFEESKKSLERAKKVQKAILIIIIPLLFFSVLSLIMTFLRFLRN